MRRRPFRYRLTLWYIAVLAAAQLVMAVAAGLTVRLSGLRSVDRELRQKATQPLRTEDLLPRPRQFDRADFRRTLAVRLPLSDANLLWNSRDAEPAARGEMRFANVWVENEHARTLTVPWRESGKIVGVIQVARPLAGYDDMMGTLLRSVLVLLPLSLLLAALGGSALTRRALAPVRAATRLAAEIGVEDLSRRLAVHGEDELADLARTFNAMFDRLEASFEQQRGFIADAAHELRTPLSLIKVSSSMALAGAPDADEDRRALSVIDQAADGMTGLVGQLLLLARADAGQLAVEPAEFEAVDLLEAAIAAVPSAAGRVTIAPGGRFLMTGDLDLLCRALVNLVSNALRHSPEAAPIELRAASDGHSARLAVVDHGEGIAPEHLARVTERFYRVDRGRGRREGGTGLGLSIVEGIARAHGGALVLRPTPGGGLTAELQLPLSGIQPAP
ncbi:MAG: HAMP domain-containing histidine kinase [Armatimonadetes bacterium]|nr:HAMP domain-containing histidine kinase [Armatimonadota bacterium]